MNNDRMMKNAQNHDLSEIVGKIKQHINNVVEPKDTEKIGRLLQLSVDNGMSLEDVFGLNPLVCALQTAEIAVEEIGLKRDSVVAILLYQSVLHGYVSLENIEKDFGKSVALMIRSLVKINQLYSKNPVIESENFRNLLLSFAEDMRVILIMIADRVNLMRQIRNTTNEEAKREVSQEAAYLYAPLAHKLGLYKLKSELEDLSLKYLEHDAYYHIKEKLNSTKQTRDKYIESFIQPIEEKLRQSGITNFYMKGRTKSIHSIWQKMKKQKCKFEGIYDLFAIRIIIDAPLEKEKMQCWQAYSIITDMYQPNPKRLRDWLSVPKSNGYESLHITVLGPENKWVEVQIRTERMDDIAERGLAAHWRYKGVKGDNSADNWLASIRTALEAGDDLQVMDQFKLDLYEDEVFVFTPKGEIKKFVKGATVLDFAYYIHSGVGNKCVGAKINDKNVSIKEPLKSGDTIEILTHNNQKPNQSWLKIVKTSKAKSKIRLALKETQAKDALYVKELLERRFKNKKIDLDEGVMNQLVKKMGFKEASEFYKQVADDKLDVNNIIDSYIEMRDKEQHTNTPKPIQSAEDFSFESKEAQQTRISDDVLVIDKNLKGVEYSLAKCCNPIYGDNVFGFVTVSGGIKIHRKDCKNATQLRKRFGYRIVKARWSGQSNASYAIVLRVVGNDDIGIVNNLTSIISKEEHVSMRSINIDSHDGLFSGNLTVQIEDVNKLDTLIKKLQTVKGVKLVKRL